MKRNNLFKSKQGQAIIYGMLILLVAVIVFTTTLPIWWEFIDVGVNASVGKPHETTITLLLQYLPVIGAIVLLIAGIMLLLGRAQP